MGGVCTLYSNRDNFLNRVPEQRPWRDTLMGRLTEARKLLENGVRYRFSSFVIVIVIGSIQQTYSNNFVGSVD